MKTETILTTDNKKAAETLWTVASAAFLNRYSKEKENSCE